MKALEDLEAAFAAATQGEWVVKRPTFGTGVFVAPSGAQSARCAIAKITHVDEDVERANAELIALMHNALPALIEVARWADATREWAQVCFPEYADVECVNELSAALAKLENTK